MYTPAWRLGSLRVWPFSPVPACISSCVSAIGRLVAHLCLHLQAMHPCASCRSVVVMLHQNYVVHTSGLSSEGVATRQAAQQHVLD